MGTMNYEEKYRKLLDAIKEMMEANPHDEGLQNWVHDNVPELTESEDERIRKALIRFHKSTIDIDGIKGSEIVSWLEKQVEPVDKGEISDGFHTFNELYYYRMLYNAAFFNMLPKSRVHKSKRHNDGEECFGGGWFIVTANLPTGQISNHYELKDWDLFQIPEKERADKWDGHTPQEAAERLHKFLLEKQDEKEIEPKFKVGDCLITDKDGIIQIGAVNSFYYTLNNMTDLVKDYIKQKPSWSEEDERICQCLIRDQEEALDDVCNDKCGHSEIISDLKEMYRERIAWLKSIKDRVK